MAIPESQFERWSNRGAVMPAKQTHESIRTALDCYDWPNGKPEVYLQAHIRTTQISAVIAMLML